MRHLLGVQPCVEHWTTYLLRWWQVNFMTKRLTYGHWEYCAMNSFVVSHRLKQLHIKKLTKGSSTLTSNSLLTSPQVQLMHCVVQSLQDI